MFRQLSAELMNLVRIQFIISTAVYLLCVVGLPQYGFSGRVMQIYPCLAAGYFILFILYAEIIFLYYFNDLTGRFGNPRLLPADVGGKHAFCRRE